MSDESVRSVSISRTAPARFLAENVRGGTLTISSGDDTEFTPVELLLVAIGACSASDVDIITTRRAEPTQFTVAVRGDKIRDAEKGNRMVNLDATFTVTFPDGQSGDAAREALPRAVQMSHDRLCTVSRTVELASPVTMQLASASGT